MKSMILVKYLSNLSRKSKQSCIMFFDFILVLLVLLSSFSIRLGYWYWPKDELFWIIFISPFIAIPIFISFKLYRSVTRYIGLGALASILQAITLYALIWGMLGYMMADETNVLQGIPRSVILINWMLCVLSLGGSRIFARMVFAGLKNSKKTNVIIYGAGSSGRQLSHALQLSEEYNHVAYIDDDLKKIGNYINNIEVYSFEKIKTLIIGEKVGEVLLALPSISRNRKNIITESLKAMSVQVRSLPSVSELAEGKVKIEDLFEIDINALLGRKVVIPDKKLIELNILKKVVLVTGAGGSIGSELCRQIIFLKPKKLILYDISEPALYQIDQELKNSKLPDIKIYAVLGSIKDKARLIKICKLYDVSTIYHAAAYKHVPLVESNQSQGILNNAIGTMLAAQAAIAADVQTFLLISTDKAVRPTSVMGASKRIAELILQAYANETHNTCFTMVRFGNVLNSSGSVIPLFRGQIKSGGPVTVTDQNMVRYFMTIPEAVELVIQVGALSLGGEVFVLDMGEPVRINDLALKMIELSGLQLRDENNPDGDIEIKYTGLRPGEKLYEELLVDGEFTLTDNKLIMHAKEGMISLDKLKPILDQLEDAAINNQIEEIYKLIKLLIPGFTSKFNSKV